MPAKRLSTTPTGRFRQAGPRTSNSTGLGQVLAESLPASFSNPLAGLCKGISPVLKLVVVGFFKTLLEETGWLGAGFIRVCLESRWLGQKTWFLFAEPPCRYVTDSYLLITYYYPPRTATRPPPLFPSFPFPPPFPSPLLSLSLSLSWLIPSGRGRRLEVGCRQLHQSLALGKDACKSEEQE